MPRPGEVIRAGWGRLAGAALAAMRPCLAGLAGVAFSGECVHCRRERGVSVTLGDGGGIGALGEVLCAGCVGRVRRAGLEAACGACGGLVGTAGAGCQRCGGKGLAHVAGVLRLGVYEGPLRSLLLGAKFRGDWPVAARLGRELAGLPVPEGVEGVVPVPLHRGRMFRRGYNVAEVMAREVARGLGLGWGRWLVRCRATVPQSRHADRASRWRNVAGAFRAASWGTDRLAGRSLLLVDDILTSGATATECARVLRRAGAREVWLLVAAVADPRSAERDGDEVLPGGGLSG